MNLVESFWPARLGRSFRWLLASTWVTNLGDGITLAAGPLLVASQSHNPLVVASAAFLQRLPWLMFGLYAGVVADRRNRRAIIVVTGLARVSILVLLTASIVTHMVSIAMVLAVLFLFGVCETFGETTTTTLLPMLVDKPDLGIANSRAFAGIVVWNQMAGPPVGAALFAAGMALPFVTETVCVLAGVLLLIRVRLPAHGNRGEHGRVRDDIREGWRWLWAHAAVRTLAITIFTFNVTFGAAWSVLVLYARDRLGMGELGFGLITTAMAVGGLIGVMGYGWLERNVRLGVIMRGGLIIETLTHLALALTRWAWFALIVFTIFGAHAFVWGTVSTSVRQRAVPENFQGRVGPHPRADLAVPAADRSRRRAGPRPARRRAHSGRGFQRNRLTPTTAPTTPHPASTARCVQASPGPVRAPSSAWLNGRIGSIPETEFSAAE